MNFGKLIADLYSIKFGQFIFNNSSTKFNNSQNFNQNEIFEAVKEYFQTNLSSNWEFCRKVLVLSSKLKKYFSCDHFSKVIGVSRLLLWPIWDKQRFNPS